MQYWRQFRNKLTFTELQLRVKLFPPAFLSNPEFYSSSEPIQCCGRISICRIIGIRIQLVYNITALYADHTALVCQSNPNICFTFFVGRPRLLNFVLSLADEDVQAASQKAFTALPDLKESIQQLSILKGIGPATASAVLAAYAPSIAPFMSDEVWPQ